MQYHLMEMQIINLQKAEFGGILKITVNKKLIQQGSPFGSRSTLMVQLPILVFYGKCKRHRIPELGSTGAQGPLEDVSCKMTLMKSVSVFVACKQIPVLLMS